MERALFTTIADPAERLQNLKDTADGVEQITYMKPFEADEMVTKKEQLAEVSININKINVEKKAANDIFTQRLKEPTKEHKLLLTELEQKANQVEENCFLFFDENEKMACYYNGVGVLVTARPMTPKELTAIRQQSIPGVIRDMTTGTHD